MMTYEPTLYIIMRKDIPDMNPGKAMAQAAHAQAMFDLYEPMNYPDNADWPEHIANWRKDGESSLGFGRTLVLTAWLDGLFKITNTVRNSGLVTDPTYPVHNYYGELYTTSAITCAWAFPVTDQEVEYMKRFELHP